MCKEIDKLEEVYNRLPDIPHFSKLLKNCNGRLFEYKVENEGQFTSISLHEEPDISIAKSHLTKGSEVPLHNHPNSYEIIIVLKGMISIEFENGDVKVLRRNDFAKIDAILGHSASVGCDTEFIAITVPRDEGFPK